MTEKLRASRLDLALPLLKKSMLIQSRRQAVESVDCCTLRCEAVKVKQTRSRNRSSLYNDPRKGAVNEQKPDIAKRIVGTWEQAKKNEGCRNERIGEASNEGERTSTGDEDDEGEGFEQRRKRTSRLEETPRPLTKRGGSSGLWIHSCRREHNNLRFVSISDILTLPSTLMMLVE